MIVDEKEEVKREERERRGKGSFLKLDGMSHRLSNFPVFRPMCMGLYVLVVVLLLLLLSLHC